MVRRDDVHHVGGHAVALGDVRADLGVCSFDLVADRLADVVQQRAHLRDMHVRPHLGGEHGGDVRGLDGMSQLVLAVARAVLQPAEQLDDLRMKHLQADLDDGLLAGILDRLLDLAPGLLDFLLDARRVDAAILHQAADGDAGDLAPDRIERRDQDGLGRVVDDQVDARGLLDGADVASLAADDAALHFVGRAAARWPRSSPTHDPTRRAP